MAVTIYSLYPPPPFTFQPSIRLSSYPKKTCITIGRLNCRSDLPITDSKTAITFTLHTQVTRVTARL